MYDEFNQKARDIICQAGLEAAYFGYDSFAPGHILLAMARADPLSDPASAFLHAKGILYPDVMRAVISELGCCCRSIDPSSPIFPDFYSDVAIDNARKAAYQMGHVYRGSEHLLIGIAMLNSGQGTMPDILRQLSINRRKLEKDIRAFLGFAS